MIAGAPQSAVRAPLRIENYREKIGPAIWLYLELLGASNERGVAMRRLDRLAADLGSSEEQIQGWLGMLHGTGLIEPTTPPPFLVIRLSFWPGASTKLAESAPASYSHSSQSIIESESNSNSYSPRDPSGLLKEILDVLGESEPEQFRPVLDLYPAEVIKATLDRVRAAGEIRKSKTALFRYLLGKLSKPYAPR